MNAYEEKQERKRERLELASDRATAASTAAFNASQAATAGIPFGQPILVGHHSEGRHRSALRRSDNAMRHACAFTDAANEYARRAEAVGTGGISSDDPEAVAKLAEKRTDLEIQRDQMKAANVYYKAHGTLDGADLSPKLLADGLAALRFQPYYNKPFPPYSISGIGARIRDAAKRAATIEAIAAMPASVEEVNGATITADPDDNRVLLAFPARLSKENYKLVRRYGFVWSPTRTAFVRKLSTGALCYARQVAGLILPAETTPPPPHAVRCGGCDWTGPDDGTTCPTCQNATLLHIIETAAAPAPVEYISNGQHVLGAAKVGDVIGYGDVCNQWDACEVTEARDKWGSPDYTLRSLSTGIERTSDCRQHGWTFGTIYTPEG